MRQVNHMPIEAKVMNYTANLLVLLFVIVILCILILFFIRLPIFTVKAIVLQGDVVKTSKIGRAHV